MVGPAKYRRAIVVVALALAVGITAIASRGHTLPVADCIGMWLRPHSSAVRKVSQGLPLGGNATIIRDMIGTGKNVRGYWKVPRRIRGWIRRLSV
jgi:hypothetical protein